MLPNGRLFSIHHRLLVKGLNKSRIIHLKVDPNQKNLGVKKQIEDYRTCDLTAEEIRVDDLLRQQVEKSKRIHSKEMDRRNKLKKKLIKRPDNSPTINDMLKNFFIDHNGKLVKRTTFPIQVENLPGLINKVCKAKIQSIPTIEKN